MWMTTEAMLAHAVAHPMRHRFQLDAFGSHSRRRGPHADV